MRQDVLWILVAAALLVLLSVLLLSLWVWRNQERVAFQPQPGPYPQPPDSATRLDYRAADGQSLFGFVVGDRAANRLVLVFHGNGDLAVRQLEWAAELAHRARCTVFVTEYRGYAGLPGRPTYEGSRLDAAAAWATARATLDAEPARTSLFGHSLGSAIATELAESMADQGAPPHALVLQSPLQSARAMARVIAGRPMEALWDAVSRVHFDTEARVRRLQAPAWVSHGARDFVIPSRMGRAVFAAARVPGELLVVAGAGHNDVPEIGGEDYWRWLTAAVTA